MIDIQSSMFDKDLCDLSESQARYILSTFINIEGAELDKVDKSSIIEVDLNYSKNSVIVLFKYVLSIFIKMAEQGPPKNELLKELNKSVWLMRISYYFGASLLKCSTRLKWDIGERGAAFENHPVISGFDNGIEAAVITISKNVILSIIFDRAPLSRVDDIVDFWFNAALST